MKQIVFKNDVLIYFGNPAGYRNENKVVLDSMFCRPELISYLIEKEKLEVEVKEGVYDRLLVGGYEQEKVETVSINSSLQVYQLKKDSPILKRFISLEERKERGFGEPHPAEYDLIYETEIDTFDLEEIWERFARSPPKGFEGHFLSISDVLVLFDGDKHKSFYINRTNFQEILFNN